jgi:hypothetical protein
MSAGGANELGVFIEGGRPEFRPGDIFRVSVLWALAVAPEKLEARLFWYTRGKGTDDVGVVDTRRIDGVEAAGERAVTFTLPGEPWSFSGKLISLVWAVELVAEPGGRTARVEFTVSPDGREILLHETGKGGAPVESGG